MKEGNNLKAEILTVKEVEVVVEKEEEEVEVEVRENE